MIPTALSHDQQPTIDLLRRSCRGSSYLLSTNEGNVFLQVLVRDNNVDQALRVLKKKMQREGVFREMKRRRFYEKPSEQATREKSEAARRARKLARKQAIRDGLIAAPKRKLAPHRKGAAGLPLRANP
jgi:small subunit ribosomal protein S21